MFRLVDLLVIPCLVVAALVLTQFFQTGRIVVHVAPLFVVPASVATGRWMDATPREASSDGAGTLSVVRL